MYMRRSHEMLSPDLTICHECLRPTNWHLPAWWVCHGSGWWVGSATQQRPTLHTPCRGQHTCTRHPYSHYHHHHPLCPSSIQTLLSRIEISLEISLISSTFLIVLVSIGVLNLFYITLLL